MDALKQVEELCDMGSTLLTRASTLDLESFEEGVQRYVDRFQTWAEKFNEEIPIPDDLRNALERLQEIHSKLSSEVVVRRDQIGQALGDVHRKEKAHKAYIDQFPKRITLTGKRKG